MHIAVEVLKQLYNDLGVVCKKKPQSANGLRTELMKHILGDKIDDAKVKLILVARGVPQNVQSSSLFDKAVMDDVRNMCDDNFEDDVTKPENMQPASS